MGAEAMRGNGYEQLFSPIRVGPMALKSRVLSPPHFSAIGNLWGSEKDALRTMAYWERRLRTGVAWITVTGRIRNLFIPGFEPTGMSADTTGFFRLPYWVERARQFRDLAHAHGAVVACQMTMIGNHPHAASRRVSSPVFNTAPHVLNRDEIAALVEEYRWSARRAAEAGLDGIEVHANHDDLLQYFLSPLTNERDDAYGGSLENRLRFLVEMLHAMRSEVGRGMAIGVRLNMEEHAPEGYDAAQGLMIARLLEATGLIDFMHLVVGSPWGAPSYVQPHFYQPGQWAELCGRFKKSLALPVVHSGLINTPAVAERILAAGQADIVGIARAFIAEPELLSKARDGNEAEIRPCVGCNDCISRRYTDNLPFGCAVNPHTSNEMDGQWPQAARRKKLLVIGGGPAGMELAGLARESGHEVEIWEADDHLGGQLAIAARAPAHERYGDYISWQQARLERVGVGIRLNHVANVENTLSSGADAIAVASGAYGRRPSEIIGANNASVLEIRDVLGGKVQPGRRVLVVAMDDHMPPLALADFLAQRGHAVTMVYGTPAPGQGIGRYIVGAPLARLDAQGVQIRIMEQVLRIAPGRVEARHSYSGRLREITDFDSVVLACGGEACTDLFDALRARRGDVHILGDAFAPRRLVFATRQAYALAKLLNA